MALRLKGSTSGSVELDVPAAVSGGDVTLTLPNGTGVANQFLKNGSAAGTLEYSSLIENSSGNIQVTGTRSGSLQPSDNDSLELYTSATSGSANTGSGLTFYNHDSSGFEMGGTIQVAKENGTADNTSSYMRFSTRENGSSAAERMRLDSSGRLLMGATAAVSGADANGKVQVSQDVGSNTCILVAENTASSGNLSCIRARLRNSAPNSVFSAFLQCDDSGANRATLRSNGGLANYSANNANLSDRNAKKNITAAADTWNRVKEWEIVNYRYKDQPDDADLNLGVIAQQVNESCPEVVTVFQEAKEATETEPAQEERLGVKEQQMHWMAIKALQEAIAKIETLEARVTTLEAS